MKLAIIVPTWRRPESFTRLCLSIARYAPEALFIAVIQDAETQPLPKQDCLIHRMEPGFPGQHRAAGALAANALHGDAGAYLFLDDDHELLPIFPSVLSLLEETLFGDGNIGLIVLPTKGRTGPGILNLPHAAMGGGLLVRADAYWSVGGFGEDYLDDIELSLRLRWAGWRLMVWPERLSIHHHGISGGLRSRPGVEPKRDAHLRLSRLHERYPDRIERDPQSWWGFREKRPPKEFT